MPMRVNFKNTGATLAKVTLHRRSCDHEGCGASSLLRGEDPFVFRLVRMRSRPGVVRAHRVTNWDAETLPRGMKARGMTALSAVMTETIIHSEG